MNNPGQSNQSGIFAQDWAAISLFMQYLGYESFDYIHLEAPKFQDFNLVFKDGHKVICESKARKRAFSFSNLKKILANLLQKDCVSFNDEVLIICLKVSPELKEAIKFVEYDSLFNKKIFTQKKFSSAEIKLLPQVKFWEATPAFNEKLAYNLFTDFVAPKFWLPKRRLEDIVNTIFVKEIFEKSTKGAKFFKRDILNRINKRVDDIVDDESKYDEEQVSIVKKLKAHKVKLYAQHKLSNNDVAFISTNPAIHSFVLNEIEKKKNIELKKNDSLWLASKKLGFFGKVIGIFIKNINHNDNAQYIIEFIKKNITNLHGFYSIDFFKIEAIKLTRKILELDQSYIDDAYEIVEKILSDNTRDFFYIRNNSRINYEKKEVCKLLIIINESARPSLKTQIYKFITKTFNLITDSNGHEHYTPSDIFSIVKDYLIKPFDQTESRVLAFTQVISDQFDAFYKRYDEKFCFEGWEEIGSTSVSVGDTYTVVDRNFVHCIEGALKSYYEEDSQRAWKFIKENCISTEKKEINKGRPDFLSRAVISIILKRYQDKNLKVSNEAFEILKKFILFRKGIPSKAELIYQQIRRKENEFSNDQKWKLINIYLEEFKIPSTPTVEKLISQMARDGSQQAKEKLVSWLENPDYYRNFFPFRNIIENIRNLLKSDFDFALKIYKKFISSSYFIKEFDSVYEIATLIQEISKIDFDKGLDILRTLENKEQLSKNEQLLLSYGFFKHNINDAEEDPDLLLKINAKFVNPLLKSFKFDNEKIREKFTEPEAREAFVKFADRLARHKYTNQALEIIKAFINDPDPYLPSKDPNGPNSEYNQYSQIEKGEMPSQSVRGWCARALKHCLTIESRDLIPNLIELTEKLINDENWYVKHMACFPLTALARARLILKPDSQDELFFNVDPEQTFIMAKRIESLAFSLLQEVESAPPLVQKAMAESVISPFNHIRALNTSEAQKLIQTILNCHVEVQVKASRLFIYFAEFRKFSYQKWQWKVPGYYDDLSSFDNKSFKDQLEKLVLSGHENLKKQLACEFYVLPKNEKPEDFNKNFEISLKYLNLATHQYQNEVFKDIYHFINDNIEAKFEECFDLWKTCLEVERQFFKKHEKQVLQMYWWPNYNNGDILLFLKENNKEDDFLEWLLFLSEYPLGLNIANNLYELAEQLLSFSKKEKKQVEIIFDNLIKRNTSILELKEKWEKQNN